VDENFEMYGKCSFGGDEAFWFNESSPGFCLDFLVHF